MVKKLLRMRKFLLQTYKYTLSFRLTDNKKYKGMRSKSFSRYELYGCFHNEGQL